MKSLLRRGPRPPLLLLLTLAAVSPAPAAPRPSPACAPDPGDGTVALASVSDDLDVTLADGRILRLAGLDPARATAGAPDLPARARAALTAWVAGEAVTPHALSLTPDRWGRIPALLFRPGPDAPQDAVAALLAAGLGRARPEPGAHACFPALLAAEAEARGGRLGLWADPGHAILTPADADGLAAQAGGMALVEGVMRVHEGRGALYLALGRDRRGFAAVVSRRDARSFAQAGLDLHDYEGTPVRLRGDLDVRFGPRMRLVDPDAIESLEPGSIVEPSPKHWTVPRPAR